MPPLFQDDSREPTAVVRGTTTSADSDEAMSETDKLSEPDFSMPRQTSGFANSPNLTPGIGQRTPQSRGGEKNVFFTKTAGGQIHRIWE
jgi:hypothetical protein